MRCFHMVSLALLFFFWVVSPVHADERNQASRMADCQNAFGFKLFAKLFGQEKGGNVFISPSSISFALTMAYNGALGSTRTAMGNVLGFSGLSLEEVNKGNNALIQSLAKHDSKTELEIANSLWVSKQEKLKRDFEKANKKFLHAEASQVDFLQSADAASRINGWVSDKTRGKISRIVDPGSLGSNTRIVLVNAVYFKGMWAEPFDKKLTNENDRFNLSGGKTKKIPMMTQSGSYRYFEDDKVQGIDLPYGKGKFSMLIFLPRKKTTIEKVGKSLTAQQWKKWISSFDFKEGTIWLPRFKLEFAKELGSPLRALGMGEAFQPGADFTGMLERSDVFINAVLHKTVLEVDEEGSVAAAATGVFMVETAVRPTSRFEMRVDRPFFCAIRDNESGAVLFLGAIMDPQ